MKRRFTLQHHIKKFIWRKKASFTLEAALIFPIIVFVFIFFYMILLACSIQMTMKSVATTTVNSIASNIHAVDYIGQLAKRGMDRERGSSADQSSSTSNNEGELLGQLLTAIPEPFYSVAEQGRKGNWWPATNLATTLIGKKLIEQMLTQLPESKALDQDRISLVYLQLPDIINYSDATVKITLQYEFPFNIPFTNKRFVIREQATQRAWLPDSRSNNFETTDDDMFIQVISISPTPVRPGNKAKITVKTKPHAILDISIFYKSGASVAKNLESKQADENGEMSWEWFVSGNTTHGIWQYEINEVNGQAKAKGVFEVKKKKG